MDRPKLAHMANAIGDFFAAEPDRTAALEGIAGHLKRFWDPRMRRELLRFVDQGEIEGLSPLVLEAIRAHRQTLAPPAG
jgi:formate dehydrogenase subunit delta